jgi:hypothetical protein
VPQTIDLARPVRRLFLIASLAFPLALAACGDPCQDVANRICGCEIDSTHQSACRTRVSDSLKNGTYKPSQTDHAYCSHLLDTCPDPADDPQMCARLSTPQGKIDCGLAYPPPK